MTVAELITILSTDWPQDDIVMVYDPDIRDEFVAHSVNSSHGKTRLSRTTYDQSQAKSEDRS